MFRLVKVGALLLASVATSAGCGGGGSVSQQTASAVTARAFFDLAETPGSETPTAPTFSGKFAPAIRISWSKPARISVPAIIEYQIWREDILVGVAAPDVTSFDDRVVAGYFDFIGSFPFYLYNFSYHTVAGNNAEGINTAVTQAPTLTLGKTYHYSVKILYTMQNGNAPRYRLESLGARSGGATTFFHYGAFAQPHPTDRTSAAVSFNRVQGADEYTVEFSDRPDFGGKVARFAVSKVAAENQPVMIQSDLFKDFGPFTANTRIYFRLGVRNSTDNPGPLPLDTPEIPKGGDYVYRPYVQDFVMPALPLHN